MWQWFRNYQRKKILATPFPSAWEKQVQKNLQYYQHLTLDEKKRLQELIQIFIAEKTWSGCNGLILTDEIRVTIAAHACLLILALPNDSYRNVESIYVYPTTVFSPESKVGFFEVVTNPVRGPMPILGEAHHHGGPVILVWDEVKKETRHPEYGHNVVYHEFAHKLDMLDDSADGTPPLASREEYQRWTEVCSKEYLELCEQVEQGEELFFDSYAATDEAEFFAVATEHFFCEPKDMKLYHPELYQVLQSFYRQDPATRSST
ncbi:MAG: zinc-dependent peptidase [Candidatus Nitrohelix vancouverensis]|uniref:Zinc-dependent peptidase n=1 Tax=Candidatus Nitrohelix vancouverensis TaxID=2705534 RepID=A0A7T0C5F4_9BACT|nr:MAG: zinc-dependent peptidase [Candidatus Nitrohelix vancouverensis]